MTLQEALATVGDMYGFDVQRKGQRVPRLSRRSAYRDHSGQLPDDGPARSLLYLGEHRRVTANDNNNGNNNNFDNGLNNSGNNNSQGNTASGDNNTNSNGTRIETDSNNDYWTDLRDSRRP